MRTIIVDDEPVIVEEMTDMLGEFGSIDIVGTYSKPLVTLSEAERVKPDCAFLDIEMMGMNGIELAERLLMINPNMEIVFVTAYNHYAAQAFEVSAIDYLLKPVSEERLQKCIEKIEKTKTDSLKVTSHSCVILCFGGFEVFVGKQLIKWSRARTRELLAYLLQCQGKSLSKFALCELFWPEYPEEQALAYLQTSIWTIRKKFKESGFDGIRIEYSNHRYFVSIEGASCDTTEFEKHYREYKRTGNEREKCMAIDCYKGMFMEGEDWLWAYPDRARYERMYKELVGNEK